MTHTPMNDEMPDHLKMQKTERGFAVAEFRDRDGVKCSIQKSSLATEDCIWLGADEIGLKKFKAYEGWKDVELPFSHDEHYIANNRMHLTQEQVEMLLPALTYFAQHGELPDDDFSPSPKPVEAAEEPDRQNAAYHMLCSLCIADSPCYPNDDCPCRDKIAAVLAGQPAPVSKELEEAREGLSPWSGWDQSRMPWSEAKHKDAVCEAAFGPSWSVEDAHTLISFIENTWLRDFIKEGGK